MTVTGNGTNPLVGTWKVASFQLEFQDTGRRSDVCEKPGGFIVVTADGRFTVILAEAGARLPSDAPSTHFSLQVSYDFKNRGDSQGKRSSAEAEATEGA